jgi:hypothetical protein
MDDEDVMIAMDPMVARGDLLIRLIKAIEETKEPAYAALLAQYAVKVDRSIQVPERLKAELYSINGETEVGGNA